MLSYQRRFPVDYLTVWAMRRSLFVNNQRRSALFIAFHKNMVLNKIFFHQVTTSVTLWLRLVLLLLCVSVSGVLLADSWENTQYNTTEGNEFYITTMKNGPASTANSTVLKVYLYATARENTYICVDYKNKEDKILLIPGGGQNGISIPMEYIYTDESDAIQDADLSVKDTFVVTLPQDKSLHVYTCDAQGRMDTTKKVSLYLTNYYTNYGYEVTNVLPVRALEREYMVQTYSADKAATEFVVIATEDNQEFEMSLRLNEEDTIYFKTARTFKLNKGQTRLIRTADGFNPLSGTYICSDYKFVVYNGNQDCRITSNSSHVFEQAYSTDKWGYEYVATPTYNRTSNDCVILTAIEDGTVIEKNGVKLIELEQGYSYEDKIDEAAYYKSNKKILCYLYENGETKESPAMTTITPISMGVKSIVVAAFNATADDLGLDGAAKKAHRQIKDHYINVVTEKAYKEDIYLGNTKVTGFKQVSNTKYYHATCKLNSAAVLKCNNENGTFTARMYGDYFPTDEDLKKNITPFSYAYSAGSRVNRAVDMLINDKYIRYLRICLNDKVKFTPLIDFEYDRDNTKWIIGDDVISFTSLGDDGIVKNYQFDTTGLYDVYLVVQSYTPLCEKPLIDTVKAQIEVDDLSYKDVSYDPCFGDDFYVQHKGQKYWLKADTTVQQWEGKDFSFKIGVPKVFADTVLSNNPDSCDLVLRQVVTIHPVYKDTFDTTACDVWYWEHEENGKIDTVYTFRVNPGDKLPVTKEHTIRFGTRYYDCDSIVTWRVTLNKSYSFVEDSIICQDLSGQLKYIWTGHDTIDIPIDKVGTYTYVDHLKTKHEPYCDSIHTLRLKVVPSYDSTEVVTICQNESFTWSVNGKRYVGNKFSNIQSTDVVLNTLNETITFVETFETDAFGCDSIHRLEIMVYPSYDTTYVEEICDNQIYELNDTIVYYGNKYKADGLAAQAAAYKFDHFFKTTNDCDSIVRLELYVHPTYEIIKDTAVCQQEGGIFIWDNHTSFFSVNLNKQVTTIPIDQPGTYQYVDSQVTSKGCDSVYSLVLTILPQYDRTETLAMCDNDSIQWNGEWFYGYKSGHVSSIKSDTLVTREYQNDHGCLSYKRLQLILYPSYLDVAPTDTTYKHICEDEKYETSYGKVYNANGEWDTPDGVVSRYVVIDTIETKACASCYDTDLKCDSVVASVVYVYPTYQYVTYDVICQNDNYQWVVRNQNGDSINVILDNIYDAEDRLVNGIPTDQHGQFEYRYYTKTCEECSNSVRCDSTHILYLTILPRTNTVETLWMCDKDSVYWARTDKWFYGDKVPNASGVTYTSQKDPYCIEVPASNAYGCDYEQILYLYVRPSYVIDSIVHICDNQVFMLNENISYYGDQYKADGLAAGEYHYTHTFKTTDCSECADKGCDSIINLTLFVHKTYRYVQKDTVCKDDANYYSWQIIDPLNGNTTILSGMIRDEKNQLDISASNIPTNELGTFTYTYKILTKTCEDCPNSGCDSIWTLQLTVIDGYAIHREIHMCDNDTAIWNNQLYVGQHFTGTYDHTPYIIVKQISSATSSYVYYDTILGTSRYGCDSTHFLDLHVHPTYLQPVRIDTIDRCDNETYLFYGTEYNTTGEWHTGKDTTQFITLSYTDTTINGCDSAVVHVLRVHPTFNNPVVYDTICHSALPYNYPDARATSLQGLIQSGVYTHTLKTQYGCDSIITLDLTVNPSTINQVYVTWCQSAGPYTFDSIETPKLRDLEETGVYTDTLQTIKNQYGCDSIVELHLTILETIVTHLYDSVCDNQLPYNHWDTRADNLLNLTHTDVYRDTLTSELTGCDSVLVLHLQVNKTYNTTDTITICASEGSPYIWRPSDMKGLREIAIPFEIDDRVNVKDKQTLVLNDSSVLLQSVHGCDSLVNLCLIVHPTYELVEVDTVDCQDTIDRYSTWTDQLGGVHQIDISEAGWITIAENPGTIYGCDSIIGIKLYVRPTYRYDSVYTICQDERITWQGKTYAGSHYGYNYQMLSDGKYAEHRDSVYYLYEPGDSILEAGVHHDTIVYPTILGCDSTFYLTLNVLPTSNTILDVSVCDSEGEYVFKTSDKNGTYYDTIPIFPITEMIDSVRQDTAFHMRQRTLKTPDGCDSTVYLHLTVTPTYEYVTRAEICKNDTFTWRGNGYDKAGIYYDRLTTEQGCDSNYILELFVRPVLYIPKTLHACDNQTVMHSDTLWYDPDSVRFAVETTLLWKPGMKIPKPEEHRDVHYYTLDGRCDSIIYQYYLHIHPTYDFIANATICSNESYQLHDSFIYTPAVAYHEPGSNPAVIDTLITDKLKTVTCEECEGKGCDSIFSANIRILPAYKHIDSVTICSNEKYDWQDTILYEPQGDTTITYFYQKSYTTKLGCDSIYEMYLTVHQAYDHDVFDTICSDEYYHFGDTLLNQTGEYLDTLRTIHDCDSIVHLYLTVYDTTVVETYDTICVTEKYYYFGKEYTEPGVYDTITLNDWGCKQYNYLYLEVIDTTAYEIAIGDIICADDEEIIVFYERLSGKTLIEYSVLFDDFGHAQGFEDIHHATLDTTESYFSIPIPRGEVLPHPNPTYFDSQQGINEYVYEDKYAYPIPNLYRFKIIMHNGICGDSLQRKDTTVSFWYPSWIHEQHWNDGIVLYNEIYNGGYKFSKYQWFLNGDSILGATKEYLYVPNQLEMNQRGECNNYYQLAVTRLEDGYTTFTCPICPVLLYDTIVPQKDYFSVVPTIVSKINPTIHILSTRPGNYKITNLMGNQKQGDFVPDANNYAGSINLDEYLLYGITNQLILVTLVLDTGDKRTIKVIIRN